MYFWLFFPCHIYKKLYTQNRPSWSWNRKLEFLGNCSLSIRKLSNSSEKDHSKIPKIKWLWKFIVFPNQLTRDKLLYTIIFPTLETTRILSVVRRDNKNHDYYDFPIFEMRLDGKVGGERNTKRNNNGNWSFRIRIFQGTIIPTTSRLCTYVCIHAHTHLHVFM